MYELSYLLDTKSTLRFDAVQWDFFFSAYNESERVKKIFEQVNSANKYWIIIPEYQYGEGVDLKHDAVLRTESFNEAEQIIETIGSVLDGIDRSLRICVDITGLMRPQILFILRYFQVLGFKNFEMIYTEPLHYSRKEDTDFALADVSEVRQVSGFEGVHHLDMSSGSSRDILLLGVGYDSDLMARVALDKDRARHLQLLSLPSLSADMYQESLIRLDRAGFPNSRAEDQVFFSSANDPFLTAAALSKSLRKVCKANPATNIYLSPLATKPQALGFGIFYLKELEGSASSIIFPFSSRYSRETSKGVGRTWRYPICLD